MRKIENFSIRPIEDKDRDLLLKWRNLEPVRKNMYTDHIITQEEHEAWFSKVKINPSAVYLIFSFKDRPVGLISFAGISPTSSVCTWAFYLGENDVPVGTGAIMEFFALDYAFLELKIRKLYCEVFAFNSGVIKLHERFRFEHEGRLKAHYKKNGEFEDVVCLAKFGENWTDERDRFMKMCFKN